MHASKAACRTGPHSHCIAPPQEAKKVPLCPPCMCAVAVQILQPDLDEEVQQQPVASVIYDKHKATLGDTLGRPRLLGAGPGSALGPDYVFGKPCAREQEPCVGELIRGSGGRQEQQVDPGPGTSLTRWRNTSETAERVSRQLLC